MKGGSVDPHVDALLFAADRIEHYKREVEPKLREGYIVITERYVESSIAYHGAAGVPVEFILYINSLVPRPHLTIILDVDPGEAVRRIAQRGAAEKYEVSEFLHKVRDLYLRRARAEGYPVVNAGRPPEEVADEVVKIITNQLQHGGYKQGY